MATIWYVDGTGNRAGPIELTQAVGLVKTGMIGPATLVWAEGMTDWAPASHAPLLAGQFIAAPPTFNAPPGFPPTVSAAPGSSTRARGALTSDATVWGIFWRIVVYTLGTIFVIPAPWVGTMWIGYVGQTTRLPDGSALRLAGRAGDIWWVFILLAAGEIIPQFLQEKPIALGLDILVMIPLSFVMNWLIIRWFVDKLETPSGRLSFTGGLWGYLGYSLLLIVSIYTFVGWAWVLKFMVAWGCRNVQGPARFEFRGSGLSILWRTLVAALASCFVLPIPWMIAWQYRWFVSQIHADMR